MTEAERTLREALAERERTGRELLDLLQLADTGLQKHLVATGKLKAVNERSILRVWENVAWLQGCREHGRQDCQLCAEGNLEHAPGRDR